MKENYDPTEKNNEVTTQQNSLAHISSMVSSKDISLQNSLAPQQFHQEMGAPLRSHATLPTKRKKRSSYKGSKIPRCNLSVIERHKQLGQGALDKLKKQVHEYAVDHTYKETSRKFGIHHSTVSGWIKQSSAKQHQLDIQEATKHQCRNTNDCQQQICGGPIQFGTDNRKSTRMTLNCSCLELDRSKKICEHNSLANKVRYISGIELKFRYFYVLITHSMPYFVFCWQIITEGGRYLYFLAPS